MSRFLEQLSCRNSQESTKGDSKDQKALVKFTDSVEIYGEFLKCLVLQRMLKLQRLVQRCNASASLSSAVSRVENNEPTCFYSNYFYFPIIRQYVYFHLFRESASSRCVGSHESEWSVRFSFSQRYVTPIQPYGVGEIQQREEVRRTLKQKSLLSKRILSGLKAISQVRSFVQARRVALLSESVQTETHEEPTCEPTTLCSGCGKAPSALTASIPAPPVAPLVALPPPPPPPPVPSGTACVRISRLPRTAPKRTSGSHSRSNSAMVKPRKLSTSFLSHSISIFIVLHVLFRYSAFIYPLLLPFSPQLSHFPLFFPRPQEKYPVQNRGNRWEQIFKMRYPNNLQS